MFNNTPPFTLKTSVAQIGRPRIDHAALNEAHRARQARARLFQPGTRVYVTYRLKHQDHPYKPLYSPQQRFPVGAVCRYAGPSFMTTSYYDVETDAEITTAYHTVIDAAGEIRCVLAGDMQCVEIEAPAATVPATLPVVCRALVPFDPRQIIQRLVAHIDEIIRTANRTFFADATGALHVGQEATLTPTPDGVLVSPGRMFYPVSLALDELRRLVKACRERFAASEAARFFADLKHELRALPGLYVTLIPRDGAITVDSNRYPRLKITVQPDGVTLSPYISTFRAADGERPAWFRQYRFSPAATDLHAQIAAAVSTNGK